MLSLSSCLLRGVCSPLSIWAARKTRPFSVWSPTASTRRLPLPSITFVPRSTRLEGNVASASKSSVWVVLEQMGSPVSVLSSTFKLLAESSVPSAGTSSPVSSRTKSPTTISRRGTEWLCPLRTTRTGMSSLT